MNIKKHGSDILLRKSTLDNYNQYYPAFLDLNGRLVVVIGGGIIAERKIQQLLAANATVSLISPDSTSPVAKLAQNGTIQWYERVYQAGDLNGAWLAIAATDNSSINEAIAQEAEQRKIFLNVVDKSELCGFIAPSIIEKGPVTIAISTAGKSPALARKLRELIDGTQNPEHYNHEGFCRCIEWADAIELLAEVRTELKSEGVIASPEKWQSAMDTHLLETIQSGQIKYAKEYLKHALYPNEGH